MVKGCGKRHIDGGQFSLLDISTTLTMKTVWLLIFSKNMTTDSLLVRYIFKVVIGEYWDGTKEVERGGEEAVASWADAAKG
ncbi:MAG: hypothetical protein ING18_00415, partial [Burkholderiales bacterium]|nr:hypothetical protein [Burkholderiales bacterium]